MRASKIAIINFLALMAGEKVAVDALIDSLVRYGIVFISGTNITPELMRQFFTEWLVVSNRPQAELDQLTRPDIWFQRGITPPNTEVGVGEESGADYKRCYFMGPPEVTAEQQATWPGLLPENVWPPRAPRFQELYTQIHELCHQVVLAVTGGCEKAFGLEDRSVQQLMVGAAHVSRALHYLALPPGVDPRRVKWAVKHKDFNPFTVLPPSFYVLNKLFVPKPEGDEGGLYLWTREGEELYGAAPAGCITVQLGQAAEMLFGGEIGVATDHEVRPPVTPGLERTAFAHFGHIAPDVSIFPLPKFRNMETIKRYAPPRMMGSFGLATIEAIGLAPKGELMRQMLYRE